MIVGVLLAAGASTRFGANKLVQTLPHGVPVGLEAARVLAGAVDRLVVVIRAGDVATSELFARGGFAAVICDDADRGMGRSLACAVDATPDADGWLVGLADMPFILPQTVAAVAATLRREGGIVAPSFAGRTGHPVGFAAVWRDALRVLADDRGGRDILRAHATVLRVVETHDPGVIRDIDIPADLAAAPRR